LTSASSSVTVPAVLDRTAPTSAMTAATASSPSAAPSFFHLSNSPMMKASVASPPRVDPAIIVDNRAEEGATIRSCKEVIVAVGGCGEWGRSRRRHGFVGYVRDDNRSSFPSWQVLAFELRIRRWFCSDLGRGHVVYIWTGSAGRKLLGSARATEASFH
jgi:hypothetical protein